MPGSDGCESNLSRVVEANSNIQTSNGPRDPICIIASIFGAYLTLVPINESRSPWQWILVGIALAGALAPGAREMVAFWKSAPKVYRNGSKRIISYMCRWVGSGGVS
jgi:hypothetical protein